jgi:hypothetical protein
MRSRQSGSPDSVPTAIKRNSSSNLTCPKASPLLITITNIPNAFALLCPPDEMCNVNLDHPPAHTTKAPKPTYHPPVAKPLVIDQFPSIGKDTRPPFALPFAAADRNARFHQANASISLPIPSLRIPPNRVNASTPPTVHHTAVSVQQRPSDKARRRFITDFPKYQDFMSSVGQTDMIVRTWEHSPPNSQAFATNVFVCMLQSTNGVRYASTAVRRVFAFFSLLPD